MADRVDDSPPVWRVDESIPIWPPPGTTPPSVAEVEVSLAPHVQVLLESECDPSRITPELCARCGVTREHVIGNSSYLIANVPILRRFRRGSPLSQVRDDPPERAECFRRTKGSARSGRRIDRIVRAALAVTRPRGVASRASRARRPREHRARCRPCSQSPPGSPASASRDHRPAADPRRLALGDTVLAASWETLT
jgi:hypothetical protein